MKDRRGFTLVELLGVIVIIGLVIGGSVFGILKLIGQSKDKGVSVSISSIQQSASVYATEKNNDNKYWIEMTRSDLTGKYFCATIGELQNKGLLDKNLDFSSINKGLSDDNKIDKSTYVGIYKNSVTLVNSNPVLLNDKKICNPSIDSCTANDMIYGVCTGNIINENITNGVDVSGGTSYTDDIIDIDFTDVVGENIEIDRSECYYKKANDENEPNFNDNSKTGIVNNNTCSISGLEDETSYDIRICTFTKGGSKSCDEIQKTTLDVKKPTIEKGDNVNVNISYDRTNINGDATYYFKSSIDGTSTKQVMSCVDEKNCSTNTTSIEKDKLYRSSDDKVSITYSSEGNVTVEAKTCDKTGNCASNSREFSIYKNTFKKSNADSIDGGTKDIDKLCIANVGGDCSVTSPSIVRNGYNVIGWNRNSNATTSEWGVSTSKSVSSNGEYYPITKLKEYTISYNANGGSGVPSSQIKYHNQNLTLSTTKPTRSGYTFNGWNTNANGTGTNYASGGTYSANSDVTLYAKWTADSYTVTYNANGGSLGSVPSSQIKYHNINLTLSRYSPSRSGYDFAGWNTMANGRGTYYSSGSTYTGNANLTLYAQWEKEEEPYFILDYINLLDTPVSWGVEDRFRAGFSVSSSYGISVNDVSLYVSSSDCGVKSSSGARQNCVSGWRAFENSIINAYYYTSNSNVNSANASTNGARHCLTFKGYSNTYGIYTDNTIKECYSIVK